MEIKRLPILAIETFKTINNVNPSYMKTYSLQKQLLRFTSVTLHLGNIKLLATVIRIQKY